MDKNKIFLIVFVYLAVVYIVKDTSAAGVSDYQHDEGPCDTCPRKGKCVPKVSCPAHVRPGSRNPECHLEGGQIGICCYTGRKHAAELHRKLKSRAMSKIDNAWKKAHSVSKSKWRKLTEKAKNVLEYSDHAIVRSGTPDYGYSLSFTNSDEEIEKLGEGALLNLFAAEDMKKHHPVDDDELDIGYNEPYYGPYCPPQPICPDPPSACRNISGECNNPDHPSWGAANTGYERLLPPDYSDGIWALRKSSCGGSLPSPRAVSTAMLLDEDYPSPEHNIMRMQFSQFIAHDISGAVMYSIGNGSAISCCSKEGGCLPPDQLHFACAPIDVAPEDEFFSHFQKTCLNFVRAQLAPDCNCGYAKQMNGQTHLLDLSQLYGRSKEKQDSLRASGGCLKVFNDYGRELPPLTDRPECLTYKDQACFDSGDNHGNQIITLTVIHTIFTREHNRLVRELTKINPDCDDDTYFYTAKRIMQAMYQHIVYDEWLPAIIGPKLMQMFNLASSDGYASCYDPEVNPSLMTEFAGAAMRFGHSTVDGKIKVTCPNSKEPSEVISVPEVMLSPSRLRKRHFLDCMLHSMVSQPMQCVDPFVTFGLTRYMFRGGNGFGVDLASLNVQRGRDFGIRPYNDYRQLCGLMPYDNFDEFPPTTRDRLSSVYACPKDIDLWIGGLLEKPVKGGIVGPTFAHIIAEQFSRLKVGDRYFYDYGSDVNPGAFTPSQLAELKKTSLARIICDNSDKIDLTSMSPSAFYRADLPWNTPVPCDFTVIPSMDMSRFRIM